MRLKIFFPLFFLALASWCAVAAGSVGPAGRPESKSFVFLINSDPQMGEANHPGRNIQILNELLARFVDETNRRQGNERPDFVVWNGDLVRDPWPQAFANFERIVSRLQVPSVLVHGNHDGKGTDPQFLDLQQRLSGYRKLNYAFDYGDWRFVVIASQPKYSTPEKKRQLLNWLESELSSHRDKPVMLFMHYHLLPVALSQMEYYTYTPASFRQDLLDLVTRYGNVRYVFSGHVHSGIKSSVKSSYEYRGTRFVVVPTPVFQRPFGEEYPEFADPGRYDKRGYYLEVHVNGVDVRLIGRKIGLSVEKTFPADFPVFDPAVEPRYLQPESRMRPNRELLNGGFGQGLSGWHTSWRYRRDEDPMFINRAVNGGNWLRQKAGYGGWSLDEYQETWQLVEWRPNEPATLTYHLTPKHFSKGGAGAYIRVFSYLKDGSLGPALLLHWGNQEARARDMPRSWAYHATGDRLGLWLDKMLSRGMLISHAVPVELGQANRLDMDLGAVFSIIAGPEVLKQISHVGIAHGIWTRVMPGGKPFVASMQVDAVRLSRDPADRPPVPLLLNGEPLEAESRDKEIPYSFFWRNKRFDVKNKSDTAATQPEPKRKATAEAML